MENLSDPKETQEQQNPPEESAAPLRRPGPGMDMPTGRPSIYVYSLRMLIDGLAAFFAVEPLCQDKSWLLSLRSVWLRMVFDWSLSISFFVGFHVFCAGLSCSRCVLLGFVWFGAVLCQFRRFV